MIKSFHDKETAAAFMGLPVRRLPAELRRRIRRCLDQLHAATTLDFLRSPPGNRLEALATGMANTASASMINGGFALNGATAMPGM